MGDGSWVRRQLEHQSVIIRIQHFAIYSLLIVASVAFLFPLFWMFSTALKVQEKILSMPPQLIPVPVDWMNYYETLTAPGFDFPLLLKNTLTYAVIGTLGTVMSCTLVAYSFARMQWPGRDAFFIMTLATMMIPGTVTLVPQFILFRWLGWTGTMLPLIVPGFLGDAFCIFLLRQFFKSVPMELSEAVIVDGGSHFTIMWHIILPLAKPALATVTLLTFLFCWNDFMGPLIYLTDEELFTFSIGLYAFRERWVIRYDLMMAAATIVTVPVLALFFFAQRTFIEGISLTGIKG